MLFIFNSCFLISQFTSHLLLLNHIYLSLIHIIILSDYPLVVLFTLRFIWNHPLECLKQVFPLLIYLILLPIHTPSIHTKFLSSILLIHFNFNPLLTIPSNFNSITMFYSYDHPFAKIHPLTPLNYIHIGNINTHWAIRTYLTSLAR